MNLPLRVQISKSASVYLRAMDRTMQKRVQEKLDNIAAAPYDIRHSKPLTNSEKRSARIGGYRILLTIEIVESVLRVVDIDSRGQIYRKLR